MFGLNIKIKNYQNKNKKKNFLKKKLKEILDEQNQVIKSLSKNYKYNFDKKNIFKYKKFKNLRLIGMGGSILGSQAIYDFLIHKIKKKFYFISNLNSTLQKKKENNFLNLIVSKSGNTIETISNANIYIKKKDKNIFITENKKSYLFELALKLKSEIIHHNNFIGGRVLNFICISDSFSKSKDSIIKNLEILNWSDGFYRKDIGYKVINK